jgi:hypothetical protein
LSQAGLAQRNSEGLFYARDHTPEESTDCLRLLGFFGCIGLSAMQHQLPGMRSTARLSFGSRRFFCDCIELGNGGPGHAEDLSAASTQGLPPFDSGNTLRAEELDKPDRQVFW